MKVQKFTGGILETNCYLITDEATGKMAILDPGAVLPELDEAIETGGRENVEYILLTHGHFDHIGAAEHYKNVTRASIVIGEEDAAFTQDNELSLGMLYSSYGIKPFQADKKVKNGERFLLGKTEFLVLHTPGHTRGSCSYVTDGVIFTGDLLMYMSIGRTDFPTGDYEQMKDSLQSIASLAGDYRIYPGHGECTTLEQERERNPYLGMIHT